MRKAALVGYLALAILALAAPQIGCRAQSVPAVFTLSPLELEPLAPHTSELFTISFTLTNTGGKGEYEAVLYLTRMISLFEEDSASEKAFNQTISVPAGQSMVVAFDRLSCADGLFKARIGDQLKYFEVGC